MNQGEGKKGQRQKEINAQEYLLKSICLTCLEENGREKPPCLWLLVGLGFDSLENSYSKRNKEENLDGLLLNSESGWWLQVRDCRGAKTSPSNPQFG